LSFSCLIFVIKIFNFFNLSSNIISQIIGDTSNSLVLHGKSGNFILKSHSFFVFLSKKLLHLLLGNLMIVSGLVQLPIQVLAFLLEISVFLLGFAKFVLQSFDFFPEIVSLLGHISQLVLDRFGLLRELLAVLILELALAHCVFDLQLFVLNTFF